MPLLDDDQQDPNDDGTDILEKVSLTFFKAEPANIGPFGASVLSWKVEGPAGFIVKLNWLNVPKSGERVVQPASTTSIRLSAHARQASRTLGSVQVVVDSTDCEAFEPLLNPKHTLEGTLKIGVENSEDVYFRIRMTGYGQTPQVSKPIVSLSPGRIRFQMYLAKRQDWFPDPDVDIDASFGLTVADGELVAIAEQIGVSLSVPFWAWGIPGAIPALAIAMDMGRERALKQMHDAIQGLAQLVNFYTVPSEGKRVRTVRIDNGNDGAGIIEVTACPYDLLRAFAVISEVKRS